MPATTTLATTTLNQSCGASDSQIKVASTSGLTAGIRLWVDRELMSVVSLGAVSPWVNVRRGVDGTAGAAHSLGSTLTVGSADQFYESDPVGAPPNVVLVSPWINVRSGDVWFAQGEALGTRWWQKQTTTYSAGPLGVRVKTQDPTSST